MHVNLLPQRVQLRIQWRGVMRRWRWIWVFAAASAAFYFALQIQDLSNIQTQLTTLDRQCEPLRTMQAEMNVEQEQLTALLSEKRALEKIQTNEHLLDVLGILTQAGKPVAGRIQLVRMGLVAAQAPLPTTQTPVSPPPPPGAAGPTVRPTSVLSLQGSADDDGVLTTFVGGLRDANVFDHVDLKSSTQSRVASGSGRNFQLDCRFEN
jgi:hypothetical protein